ncbi:DUF1292 domain-containing protein [Clostridium sp. P21]|uniref:DUF1292 domain-containing protein n=1 Tax=Clostridium muellerianum TaxID=2716538 RepID=A0A7Y0EDS1_9CLOT|nr:DUF1292 domain-containing protein [Clostridium muellerianum]NMM61629.1 DUF1292 domain-containing protein [Clostridium muellerianum]
MNKAEEFLKIEKDKYGNVYIAITYAINNISPFLDENTLKSRKYVSKVHILKKYMELIDAALSELNKSGFLGMFKNDKYTDLIKEYKNENLDTLIQLEKCSKCQCLNCTANCKFDSCLGCKDNSRIVSCDHKKINVTKHDSFTLSLTNNRTGEDDNYVVLSTLQDVELDNKYIIIQNIMNKEKFILHYYPGISEDTYGEITDPEEFDFIVSTFQSIDET